MEKKIPYGISYPVIRDSKGYFAPTYDTLESAKTNLQNLILTKKGDRPGRPEYGSSFWKYLFEPNTEDLADLIPDVLAEDISKWLPELIIDSIVVVQTSELIDIYKLGVQVVFRLSTNDEPTTTIINIPL